MINLSKEILCEYRYHRRFILRSCTLSFIFSSISWGNSHEFNLHPVFLFQKRVIRIITFSSFLEHISPFFKSLKTMKSFDLVRFILSDFMYKFHKHHHTSVFSSLFSSIRSIHTHITRLASKLFLLFKILAQLMNISS